MIREALRLYPPAWWAERTPLDMDATPPVVLDPQEAAWADLTHDDVTAADVVEPVRRAGHHDAVTHLQLRFHRPARDVEGLGDVGPDDGLSTLTDELVELGPLGRHHTTVAAGATAWQPGWPAPVAGAQPA